MSEFDPHLPAGIDRPKRTIRALRANAEALPGNVRGGLWLLFAGLFFVTMSSLIKEVGRTIPVLEILLVRQIVMGITVAPALARSFPNSLKTSHLKWHLMRVAGALTAMICVLWPMAAICVRMAAGASSARPHCRSSWPRCRRWAPTT